jgi:hypothetical protein
MCSFWASAYGNVLWFAEVRGIMNRRHVQEGYDQVQQALLDYTVNCYPQIQVTYSSICWAVLELFMSTKGLTLHCTDISWLIADLLLRSAYSLFAWKRRIRDCKQLKWTVLQLKITLFMGVTPCSWHHCMGHHITKQVGITFTTTTNIRFYTVLKLRELTNSEQKLIAVEPKE